MSRTAKHAQTQHAFARTYTNVYDMSGAEARAGELYLSDGYTVPVATALDAARHMHSGKNAFSTEPLPPELLGDAFAYLPLRDAIIASHVSRYWRTAALATPQLWATIRRTCNSASDMEFVTTLLSRAGSIAEVSAVCHYHPEEYFNDVLSPEFEYDSGFDTLIRPYLHKIRSLKWYSTVPADSLCDAAPFMELLRVSGPLVIQPRLLAGGSGALRTLRFDTAQLPAACPALSSVVDLRIEELQTSPSDATLRLFDLCPQLEKLYLGGLRREDSHIILSGPPPLPLRSVTLISVDPECDLLQHFAALRTPKVRMFALKFAKSGRSDLGSLPEAFLRGATALSIRERYSPTGSSFIATLPDEREHSMALPELCVPELAHRIVMSGAARLQSVRALDITIDVLEHFVAVVAAVPFLERVTIRLETFDASLGIPPRHPDTEIVGWDALEYVQLVLDAAPQLQVLVIDTILSWDCNAASVNATDAKFILSHLEFLDGRPAPVPDITVRGFAAETVRDVDLAGLPVRFDTEAVMDEASYWPYQVAYRDY